MNRQVILSYLPLYREAAWLTLRLGCMGIAFSLLIGLACAAARYRKTPLLSALAAVYIEISRNTPLLIQLFFLYYGLPKIAARIRRRAAWRGLRFWAAATWPKPFGAVWKRYPFLRRKAR